MNKQQRNLLQIQKQFWKRAMRGDKIQYDLAEQIGKDLKTHEARAAGARGVDNVMLGDRIGFHWYSSSKLICRVCEICEYDSVKEMLQDCGSGLLPTFLKRKREAA